MDLQLLEGKAILSENLVKLLGAKPKDRISIEYSNKNNRLYPVIKVSDAGNLLSKSNTFVIKGKDRDFLAQFGTEFEVLEEDENLFLVGNQEFTVYTDVETAVNENYLDLSICTDTNYNIQKYSSYTL